MMTEAVFQRTLKMKIDLTKQELELILDCISVAESQEITEELVKLREKIEKIVDE